MKHSLQQAIKLSSHHKIKTLRHLLFIALSLTPCYAKIKQSANNQISNLPKHPPIQKKQLPSTTQNTSQLTQDSRRSLQTLEKIYNDPNQARHALTLCQNLRPILATSPSDSQKLSFFHAVVLANRSDWQNAKIEFAKAASQSAPDATLASRALSTQAMFYLREPSQISSAIPILQQAQARAKPNSPEYLFARFHIACAYYLQGDSSKSQLILNTIQESLTHEANHPQNHQLQIDASHLASALSAERAPHILTTVLMFFTHLGGSNHLLQP